MANETVTPYVRRFGLKARNFWCGMILTVCCSFHNTRGSSMEGEEKESRVTSVREASETTQTAMISFKVFLLHSCIAILMWTVIITLTRNKPQCSPVKPGTAIKAFRPPPLDSIIMAEGPNGSTHEGYLTPNTPRYDNPLTLYHDRKERVFQAEQDENQKNSSALISALHRACLSLIHLQRVYQLDMHNLSRGLILQTVAPPLDAEDFYIIGMVALSYNYHVEAVKWLTMAEARVMTDQWQKVSETVPNDDLEPSNTHTANNEQEDEAGSKSTTSPIIAQAEHGHTVNAPDVKPEVWNTYSALCRSRDVTGTSCLDSLTCSLQKSQLSYILWKKETLHNDPEIILFHDVISDNEIQAVQNISALQLVESNTLDEDGESRPDRSRISQTAWLNDVDDTVLRLSRRVSDVTGLHTHVNTVQSEAEKFQINFYEPGGVYEPHYDFTGDIDVPSYLQNTGDRIATFMFYLQNVEAGGATVFPRLGVRIPVVKGGAAFWYNLHRNGSRDKRTLHAGCPVLLGSKWGEFTTEYNVKLIKGATLG